MNEIKYKVIIDDYLNGEYEVEEFIKKYMDQWRSDRDNKVEYDDKFDRLINRIFTTCDCYRETPEESHEISEKELELEVSLLCYIWFG